MITNLNHSMAFPETEEEIVFYLQEDNQLHFSKLYDRFSPALLGIILKWIRDKGTAENLLQDVFIKAWKNRELYDAEKGRLFTWLYRITRNICIDYLRSKTHKSSAVSVLQEDMAGITTCLEEGSLQPDTIGLRKVVDTLRREEKEMIDLMYFKGLTQRQIAALMDIPLGTVKTRMNKAIRKLRYYFQKDWKTAMRTVSLN